MDLVLMPRRQARPSNDRDRITDSRLLRQRSFLPSVAPSSFLADRQVCRTSLVTAPATRQDADLDRATTDLTAFRLPASALRRPSAFLHRTTAPEPNGELIAAGAGASAHGQRAAK
jgi:hypothetical protein